MKMTTEKPDMNDFELDEIFASARRAKPEVRDDFMTRLLADAAMVQDEWSAPSVEKITEGGGLLTLVWSMLGGWAGTGGLAAAAITGLWIGIAPPDALSVIDDAIWGTSVDLTVFSSDDVLGVEG